METSTKEVEMVQALARRVPRLASAKNISISFLAGGITNHNYRLGVDGETFVLRISGANSELLGIDRGREVHNHCIAASEGIAPEAIDVIMPEGYLVTRFIQGNKIPAKEMGSGFRVQAICGSLHAIHDGAPFSGTFSPFRAFESYLSLAVAKKAPLPVQISRLRQIAGDVESSLYHGDPLRPRPIHADLLNENIIDDGTIIRILDWEYSGMGDVFFDLGNLADHHSFDEKDEEALLVEYFGQFKPSDLARLKLMRIMSELREGMWGIVQRAVSTLEFDFAGYANEFFGRMMGLAADPRYPNWLQAAGGEEH